MIKENFKLWLIQKWHRLGKDLLIVLLLGTLAAWPFFEYTGLPEATDAELHIFRIAELGFSLKAGNPYPRWAPNFYSGYGYPIFNFYAPLTYHLGNWITLFNPENAAFGAKALFVLSHYIGAIGAYLLGREFSNQGGGVLGAAAFAFSPYIMVINPHVRGDLAEVFALAMVPMTLWFWECLWRGHNRASFVGAIGSGMLVFLSHNLTGLSLMIVLFLMSLWHWLILKHHTQFIWALLAGVLIMLLTAYFWLPFLLERSYIQLDNVVNKGHYDFTKHFVSISELLSLLPTQDWRATTTQVPMSAGLPMFLLAVVGAVMAIQHDLRRISFYVILSALCFWLITHSSLALWLTVPGFDFYQFPWRFLGPFAALIVPLVASLGNLPLRQSTRRVPSTRFCLLSLALVSMTVAAIPGWYVLPWQSNFGKITPASYIKVENQGRWRGTTSTNDFVPTTVQMLPAPQPDVLQSYELGLVDRVNRYTIPENAEVNIIKDVPWRNHFEIKTATKFVLRLYLFYFPGWKAYIDDQPVSIEIANPEGFITLKIPPGEHDVMLQFEDTLPRKIGWGIAALGIIIAGVSTYYYPSRTKFTVSDTINKGIFLQLAAVMLLLLIIAKLAFLDFLPWFHYTSPIGEARSTQYTQNVDFSGEIILLGYDITPKSPETNQIVDITLYWQAQRPLSSTYQSFVHLVYPEGKIWVQSDNLNPGNFPTNRWPTEYYIRDKHQLTLPGDLPPGDYQISVGLYTLDNSQRLSVLSADYGSRQDNVLLHQTIKIGR